MTVKELGSSCPAYRPTFELTSTSDTEKSYIDSTHELLSMCRVKNGSLIQLENKGWRLQKYIPGWLHRADALKLYEMAYFAQGDILELGSFRGLSTTIMANAVRNSPSEKHIYSVDMSPKCVRKTADTLRRNQVSDLVTTICSEGALAIRTLRDGGKRFAFAFIDHSHAYEPVLNVCRELASVITPGGFCLFHDFNDPRNREEDNKDYGVYQAVNTGLDSDLFEFYGIYGCTALYRLKEEAAQNYDSGTQTKISA